MPKVEQRSLAFPAASAVPCMKKGIYTSVSPAGSPGSMPAGGYHASATSPSLNPVVGSRREPVSGLGGGPAGRLQPARPQAKKEGGGCRQS